MTIHKFKKYISKYAKNLQYLIFHYLKVFFFLLFVLRHRGRSLPEEPVPLKTNPMPAS